MTTSRQLGLFYFQQGSVSSETELSQYFSQDGPSQLSFSDAVVTGSSDEEQLRQKSGSSSLDDSSLPPSNLSKQEQSKKMTRYLWDSCCLHSGLLY